MGLNDYFNNKSSSMGFNGLELNDSLDFLVSKSIKDLSFNIFNSSP